MSLTNVQQEAVDHFEGPLMVLAGPGSGKTRVITHRIARLVEQGVHPSEILALTFTNKASREMAERVDQLVRGQRVFVSTFHRFCSRVLRRWPEHVGLKSNFTILDASDQVQLVRAIMKDVGFDTTMHDPRRVLNRISRQRNELVSAEQFRRQYQERIGDPLDAVVYEVFPEYERLILQQNSVDFDALLLHVVEMLSSNPEFREYLDLQFRFILVDEYQDTNLAQYRIVHALSQHCPNVCVTGDPDQSIYGWRGARPGNILQFEQDFPQSRIVSLDQNFRSTGSIVACADRLISHNQRRHRNPLFTHNPEGSPPGLTVVSNAEAEAELLASQIAAAVADGSRSYRDFAVIYRVNALSRPIETSLSRHSVPFQVAAGFSFYERAEIRDLIAYLRLLENDSDDVALQRIINRPARGIGQKSIERLRNHAQKHNVSMMQAARQAHDVNGLKGRSLKAVSAFADLITDLQDQVEAAAGKTNAADDDGVAGIGTVTGLIERLIAEIDYLSLWRGEDDEVDQDRVANIHEFVSAARLYEEAARDEEDGPSLQGFLELASLTSEADSVDESKGAVTLLTMHAAKGLEFPVVYIIGFESGLVPHERAVRDGDPASFEEERRLLFVGVTRAMQELYLTQTRQRDFRGSRRYTISSPFLPEMQLEVNGQPDAGFERSPEEVHRARARERYRAAQDSGGTAKVMTAAELEQRLSEGAGGINSGSLTTASKLLEQQEKAEEDNPFAPGRRVRHPRYGRGVIMEAADGSSRATVTVLFEADDREETFVVAHSPLQPIG